MDILKLSQEEVITKVKEMGIKELRALREELNYSIPNLANLKKVELQDALIERILKAIIKPVDFEEEEVQESFPEVEEATPEVEEVEVQPEAAKEVVKTKKVKTTKKKEEAQEEAVVVLKDIIDTLVEDNRIPVMNMKKVRRILRSTEEVQGTHSKDGKFRWEWPITKKEEIEKSLEELLKNK